jgi:hypothetical protein
VKRRRLMTSAVFLAVICCLASGFPVYATEPSGNGTEQVLYRKPLDKGCELVVVRRESRTVSGMPWFNSHPTAFRVKDVFSVYVEYRAPDSRPLLLDSELVCEDEMFTGYDVFDVLVSDSEIIIAAGCRGSISLVRICPASTDGRQTAGIEQSLWTVRQEVIGRLDRSEASVKLSWSPSHLLLVDVYDKHFSQSSFRGISSVTSHSQFIQVKDSELGVDPYKELRDRVKSAETTADRESIEKEIEELKKDQVGETTWKFKRIDPPGQEPLFVLLTREKNGGKK